MKRMILLALVSGICWLSFAQIAYAQGDSTYQLLFHFGKAQWEAAFDTVFQQVASASLSDKLAVIRLEARTDSIGSEQSNEALARRRAQAVRAKLNSMGVQADTWQVEILGEAQARVSNATAEGRRQNRSVVLSLWRYKSASSPAESPIEKKQHVSRVRGVVVNQEGKGLPARILVRSKQDSLSLSADTSGQLAFQWPRQEVIGIEATMPGYFFTHKMLKLSASGIDTVRMVLQKATRGAVFELKQFYFKGGEAILLPASQPQLPRLLQFMKENPGVSIEIAGHVNVPNARRIPRTDWSFKLSERRARLVYNYLLEQGVDPNRMEYKGYGNWEMRFPKARTEAEMRANRRVEIRIKGVGDE